MKNLVLELLFSGHKKMASRECVQAWIMWSYNCSESMHTPILKGLDVIGTSQTGSERQQHLLFNVHTLAGFLWYIFIYKPPTRGCSSNFDNSVLLNSFNIKMPGYNWWRRNQLDQNDFKTTSYYSCHSWSFDGSLFKQSSLLGVFKTEFRPWRSSDLFWTFFLNQNYGFVRKYSF